MKLSKIVLCAGWLAFLSLGMGGPAAAYTIIPSFSPSFDLEADVDGFAGSYTILTYSHARMENAHGTSSGVSDWNTSLTSFTSWGPGGKTTGFTERIDVNLQAQVNSGEVRVGRMVNTNNYFQIQPESAFTFPPYPMDIIVRWGGNISGVSAMIALWDYHGGAATYILPQDMINFSSPGGVETYHASYTPLPGGIRNLRFNLIDEKDWVTDGSYDTSFWIEVTFQATEPGLTPPDPPPDHAPVPASLLLFGSGLGALGIGRAGWRFLQGTRR